MHMNSIRKMSLKINRLNNLIEYPILKKYNLLQFTTTCQGGVGKGNYGSFNLSLFANDNPDDVMTNRSILAKQLNIHVSDLYIPRQTHEDKITLIDKKFLSLSDQEKEKGLNGIDALITQEKDICIGVTTADCVPLLIYDAKNHALGTIHAGWKGTVQKIAQKTILRMEQEFRSNPKDLVVAIGPSISQSVFEVGDEVGEAFRSTGFSLSQIAYRNNVTKKLHIDLWTANKIQLTGAGILDKNIEISGICTFSNKEFFSARRQSINSGRIVTGGVLK